MKEGAPAGGEAPARGALSAAGENVARAPASTSKAPGAARSDESIRTAADDRLDFEAFAEAIVALVDDPDTETPLTIAIDAPWGAGKSSLAALVEQKLAAEPAAGGEHRHVTCWFDASLARGRADMVSPSATSNGRPPWGPARIESWQPERACPIPRNRRARSMASVRRGRARELTATFRHVAKRDFGRSARC